MHSSYNTSPPIHLIKNQISRSAKRIAIVQTIFMGSIITVVALLYSVLDELLAIFQIAPDDLEAMQAALMEIIDAHSTIFSVLTFVLVLILVSGIMYLIAFFRMAKSFILLAKVVPSVTSPALKVGNFLRYALFIQIASIILGLLVGVGMSYVTEIANIIAFGLLVAAYYNLSLTFKKLKENNLYPKKESRLLFYSQIVPVTAMIPLTFSVSELSSGADINLIPLIIGGVIILIGYIGLMIGFYNLSNDVKLIEGPSEVDYGHETSTVYVQPKQAPTEIQYQPKQISTPKVQQADGLAASFCPNCGNKLKTNKAFCHKCGTKADDY
ncbi:MAG: zinc ribbon domain-containing protein [Candidatus Heimdallarchaeota archaeon]|nr:zinc ribbon domain-containing protein [Candidatus Heimdallarchaeota archaeon]